MNIRSKKLPTLIITLLISAALYLQGCMAPSSADTTESNDASSDNLEQPSTDTSHHSEKANESNNGIYLSKEEPMLVITAHDNRFEVELEDNSSTQALLETLRTNGPLIFIADDYGNFEKVGELGITLPTNDKSIQVVPGDVILYQGDKLTIYYDTNSWSFTKIGHITNSDHLKEKLGEGSGEITLSLE